MTLNATVVPIAKIPAAASGAAAATTTPVRTDSRGGLGSERFNAGKRALLAVRRGQGGGANDTVGTVAVWGADLPNPLAANPLGNAFASPAPTPTVQAWAADGTTLAFLSNIPYAAFSNNNWVAETRGMKCAGTVAVSAGGVAVVGTSTTFTVDLAAGDKVVVGGQIGVLLSITDDTHATLVSPVGAAVVGGVVFNIAARNRVRSYVSSPALAQDFNITNVGGFAQLNFAIAPMNGLPSGVTTIPGAQNLDIVLYLVTPVQVLAAGLHQYERVGIRSYSALWAVTAPASAAISAIDIVLEHAV